MKEKTNSRKSADKSRMGIVGRVTVFRSSSWNGSSKNTRIYRRSADDAGVQDAVGGFRLVLQAKEKK